MNKFMRIIVFFDLPVKTPAQRKVATKFRKFLINDGYHMLQYSVYARVCNGTDAVEKHKKRIYTSVPNNGSVQMLTVTEKQYQSIEILVGALKEEKTFKMEQLTLYDI